jgi:hypothetical protein
MAKVRRFRPRASRVDRALRRLTLLPPAAVEEVPVTLADAIAQALVLRALQGDPAAVKELVDRVEGPAVCPKCGGVSEP